MPTTVPMPSLGESVIEGTIDHWLKQPGDTINAFDVLVEVITDKVNAEVTAPEGGTLVQILAQPGDVVKVGDPIAVVETADSGATPAAPVAPAETPKAADAPRSAEAPKATAPEQAQPTLSEDERVSPSVRRLAEERGVDLNRVVGTGIGGRITRPDILGYVEGVSPVAQPAAPQAQPAPAQPAQKPATGPAPVPAGVGEFDLVPLGAIRRIIAQNTTQSKTTVPHAWQAHEVDLTRINSYRERFKDQFRKKEGASLTFVPFVIKATAEALRKFPQVNAQYTDEGIRVFKNINVGVAVGMEDALVVPVIKNADSLTVVGITREIQRLAGLAQKNKLQLPDLQGGTITVNNVGTFGPIVSYSIINAPQASILTMEAVKKTVVVMDDNTLGIRSIMYLCYSFDHRLIDGRLAANFVQDVRKRLEAFDADSLEAIY